MQGMQRATGRGAVMRLAALAAALVALLALGATPAFAAAPTVTTVSPAIGPLAGGTLVTITGSGFTTSPAVNCSGNPGAVQFGGVNSPSCHVINDTTITATIKITESENCATTSPFRAQSSPAWRGILPFNTATGRKPDR